MGRIKKRVPGSKGPSEEPMGDARRDDYHIPGVHLKHDTALPAEYAEHSARAFD
jgi:hypothetical protein